MKKKESSTQDCRQFRRKSVRCSRNELGLGSIRILSERAIHSLMTNVTEEFAKETEEGTAILEELSNCGNVLTGGKTSVHFRLWL